MVIFLIRYIKYRLFSPHKGGFGIHSPLVYSFASEVLQGSDDKTLVELKHWRRRLTRSRDVIMTQDKGAGSKVHRGGQRTVGHMVSRSGSSHKYGRMLYRLVQWMKPATVLEFGTGIGISTAYLAKAAKGFTICSVDSDPAKLEVARKSLEQAGILNVNLMNNDFSAVIPDLLEAAKYPVLVHLDGDHREDKTLKYFQMVKNGISGYAILVIDDIRWSGGMENAWKIIQKDPDVNFSIDLFFMGIVIFKKGTGPQKFVINF